MIRTDDARAVRQGRDLAGDVRHYLSLRPRQLPSRALYDPLGSALFDAICELPWYPLTRAERRLIEMHRDTILGHAGSPARVVELGCGNGSKLELLLGAPNHARYVRRIDLIDISASALRDAVRRLTDDRVVSVVAHASRYEEGLAAVAASAQPDERMLVLFLGSNIGNFDAPAAAEFLVVMRNAMTAGDRLLIGADLVKPAGVLLRAYDDPLGVTAAFNKNLLVHLNRALGASFDVGRFDHRAVWNNEQSRVEMHLVSRVRQRVDVPAAGLSVELSAGEMIWTESSYKYSVAGFDALLERAGFAPTEHCVDDEGQFLLALATAR